MSSVLGAGFTSDDTTHCWEVTTPVSVLFFGCCAITSHYLLQGNSGFRFSPAQWSKPPRFSVPGRVEVLELSHLPWVVPGSLPCPQKMNDVSHYMYCSLWFLVLSMTSSRSIDKSLQTAWLSLQNDENTPKCQRQRTLSTTTKTASWCHASPRPVKQR